MSRKQAVVAALFFGLLAAGAASGQTTVFVVRHAEKAADPGNQNPALSEAGVKRAALLARVLRSVKLDAVYSTKYERTTKTVEPAAVQAGLTVTPYESHAELAEKLKSGAAGKCVLVAGHSNTVPDILKALGVAEKVEIGDGEYDNLFVVVIGKGGEVVVQRLHHGVE